MFTWSGFFELNRVRLEPTWTPNLYGFLPCKSLEVTYRSVKIIFETKINCFAFSEPPKHHFVCKTTRNEQQLVRQNYFRPRHHQLLSWQVPKSERFPSASEDSFKTTFCSFLRVSKHFWTKWVTNSFSSANFTLISEKWSTPLKILDNETERCQCPHLRHPRQADYRPSFWEWNKHVRTKKDLSVIYHKNTSLDMQGTDFRFEYLGK